MAINIFSVDAFAHEPFTGNPAAVCLLDAPRGADWMQRIAAEMNLSETAFVHPGADCFELRWFTPAVEVALCGHATLATAHVLWSEGVVPLRENLTFKTQSGQLTATPAGDGHIQLDFPATAPTTGPPPAGLVEALGVECVASGRSDFDWLVETDSATAVRQANPDFRALRALNARGLILTAPAGVGEPYDFVSRFFAPGAGIDEDPVTGSAHCCLAPYWAAKLGKTTLRAFQASARGGELGLEVGGDRVLLRGRAWTILRGTLVV